MALNFHQDRKTFFIAWVGFNFLGVLFGVSFGTVITLLFELSSTIFLNVPRLFLWEPLFLPTFFVLPLGVGIGFMQWYLIRQWDIKSGRWILSTVLGGFVPAIFVSYFYRYEYQLVGTYDYSIYLHLLGSLLFGTCFGIAQATVIKKIIQKSISWIFVNAFGFLLISLFVYGIWAFAYWLNSVLVTILNFSPFWRMGSLILSGLTIVIFPFFWFISIILPTGKLLLDNIYSLDVHEKDESSSR